MTHTIFSSEHRYTLDFTKKKVVERINYRKPSCLDKYEVASWLDTIKYRVFTGSRMDCYKYDELKAMLLQELEEKQYENVTIIK